MTRKALEVYVGPTNRAQIERRQKRQIEMANFGLPTLNPWSPMSGLDLVIWVADKFRSNLEIQFRSPGRELHRFAVSGTHPATQGASLGIALGTRAMR